MSNAPKANLPNLYLIGFMGVGKSAIGRRVAKALGFRFLDSDHEIERVQGRTIPEIFASEGEPTFRAMEKDFIKNGHPDTRCVISCGGGLVCEPGMVELVKSKGIVICLFASIETILERTGRNQSRPLLNVEDPAARIRELLAKREPIYRSAGISITTDGRSIPEVVRNIVRLYRLNSRPERRPNGLKPPGARPKQPPPKP